MSKTSSQKHTQKKIAKPSPRPADDFTANFYASLNKPSSENKAKKRTPNWFVPILVVPFFIIVCLLIILIVIIESDYGPSGGAFGDNGALDGSDVIEKDVIDEEFYENAFDETGDAETLNDDFAQAASQNEYANYVSELTEPTMYATISSQNICNALNIDCASLLYPVADSKFEKVTALNANSLDYYLDKNNIVIMLANYEVSDNTSPLIIYARADSFYLAFYADNTFETLYLTRSQVFNGIIGIPEFYIMKGVN